MSGVTGVAIAAGGAALVGGAVAGGSDDVSTQSGSSKLLVGDESAREKFFREQSDLQFQLLSQDVNGGRSARAEQAQLGYADALTQAARGPLISGQDAFQANNAARDIFAPQQLQLRQGFEQGLVQAGQTAAALGRSPDDPILRARAMQGFTQGQALLGAEQSRLAAELGLSASQRRLGFLGQAAQTQSDLAQQAIKNRAGLLGTGQDILGFERQSRFQLGETVTKGRNVQEGSLAGAIGGGLSGLAGGLTAGMKAGAFG